MEMETVVVTIPGVVLKTLGNNLEHWRKASKRTKEHRGLAKLYCSMLPSGTRQRLLAADRLKVKFVRVGGRKMDKMNVASAFKAIQDGVCNDWLGVDDGSDWYDWQWPTQEPGEVGVRIELTPCQKN